MILFGMKCLLVHWAGSLMQPSWNSLGREGAGGSSGLGSECMLSSSLLFLLELLTWQIG